MMETTKSFDNLQLNSNFKIVLDLQCRHTNDEKQISRIGWTMIPLLFETQQIKDTMFIPQGNWKLLINAPPIQILSNPDQLSELNQLNIELYFRIVPNNIIDKLVAPNVDDMDKYTIFNPNGLTFPIPSLKQSKSVSRPHTNQSKASLLKHKSKESSFVNSIKSGSKSKSGTETPKSINENDDEKKETELKTEETKKEEPLYDDKMGVGILINSLEHSSKYQYAKIRVSIRSMDNIIKKTSDGPAIWSSEFCQEGVTELGVYEWEQRVIFENFKYVKGAVFVLEIFESKDINMEMESLRCTRPGTAESHVSKISNKSIHNNGNNNNIVKSKATIWFMTEIFDDEDNPSISTGNIALNANKLPIKLDNIESFNDDSILNVCIFNPKDPPRIKEVNLTNGIGIGLDTINEFSDRPFIRWERQAKNIKFEDGDGIDLYIDSARFLPDNVTITKCYVQLIYYTDSNTIQKASVSHKICDLNESVYSPNYNLRIEYRNNLHPLSYIMIRIDTIEKYSLKHQLIGYTGINLFNEYGTLEPVKDAQTGVDISLNEGAFQLPLHLSNPPESNFVENFKKLPKLPCSTILIRIKSAPKTEDGTQVLSIDDINSDDAERLGVNVPPTTYARGEYDTTLCEPNTTELKLYSTIHKRPDKTVSSIVEELFIDKIDDKSILNDNDKFRVWAKNILKPPPKEEIKFLNLKNFLKYNESIGIGISIDGLNNVDKNSFYIVLFSFGPPSTFYQDFKLTENVHFTYNWDLDSLTHFPRYNYDKLVVFRDQTYDKNGILICDIKQIQFNDIINDDSNDTNNNDIIDNKRVDLIDYGWSFFPLYIDDEYVNSGVYQNIIFDGEINLNIINDITKIGAKEYINEQIILNKKDIKTKILKPKNNNQSIIVRIFDQQRYHIIEPKLDNGLHLSKINMDLIPDKLIQQYIYDPTLKDKKGWNIFSKNNTLNHLIPKNEDKNHYTLILARIIAKKLQLNHYKL